MEPIQVSSATEDAGPPDTGGAEQVPELPLTATPEPEPAPDRPEPPSHAQQVGEFLRTGRSGWAERQRLVREENARLKQLLQESRGGDERTQQLLREAAELVRQRNTPQEEIPDPTLDPAGFAKWLQAQNASGLDERLKPLMDHFTKHNDTLQRLEEHRAMEAQERQQIAEEADRFRGWAAEYQREHPQLAHGAPERFATGRNLLKEGFEAVGWKDAQGRADRVIAQIAWEAGEEGGNGAAAIDAFFNSLIYGVSKQLVDAGLLEHPILPASPGNGNGGAAHAGPQLASQPSEAQRLAEVRRRAAPAASAAPQQRESAPPAQHSEARELYLAGVGDQKGGWGRIKAAAIRDCGGDERAAVKLINSLRPS